MRIDLHATVRSHDGEDIGTLERAVVDPHTNEVTDFVVRTGAFFGRDIMVPREDLERAAEDGEAIRLTLTKDELEKLPDYVPERYGAPPPTWMAPSGYGFPAGDYVWPLAYDPMLGPTPMPMPIDTIGTEEPDLVTLNKGALVFDNHGDDIGVVDEMRFNEQTGRVEGFVLRVGGALRTLFGGGDTLEVSRYQIESVGESTVRLRLAKEEIEAAAHAHT